MNADKNFLQISRQKYLPPLPLKLQKLRNLVWKTSSTKSYLKDPQIRSFFPSIFSLDPIFATEEKFEGEPPPLRIGALFSGGQAPGGHNVIAGLFDAIKLFNTSSQLIGFKGGSIGVILNQTMELDEKIIDYYRNQGGFDLLGSGRDKIEKDEQFQKAKEAVLLNKLDGLVMIGGDDSNTNAAYLAEYFVKENVPCSVVGVPKTIDGDLKGEGIEIPFGFDTATKVYSDLIGNLALDSRSGNKYYYFIKIMGRSASHIALECALQAHPNLTLIGEEIQEKNKTLKDLTNEIADLVIERSKLKKRSGVILIPEGVVEFIPELKVLINEINRALSRGKKIEDLSTEAKETFHHLPPSFQEQLLLERDPHGNVQLAKIDTERLFIEMVKNRLQSKKEKFNPIPLYFGYEGRSSYPSNFDCQYSYALGKVAASLIFSKKTGYIACLKNLHLSSEEWEVWGTPFVALMHMEERNGKPRAVIKKALVDLEGKPFQTFSSHREKWKKEDDFRSIGPLQFFGPSELAESRTMTLSLESSY